MDDVRFVVIARFSVVCKKGKSMNRNVTKCYKRWWAAIVGVVLQFCWCLQPRLYSNDKFEESFVTITLGQEATNYDRRGQNDNKIGHYRRVNCKLSGSLKFAVLAAASGGELWWLCGPPQRLGLLTADLAGMLTLMSNRQMMATYHQIEIRWGLQQQQRKSKEREELL